MSEIKHDGSDVCVATVQNQVSGIRTVTARSEGTRVAEQGADPTPDLSGEAASPQLHHWASRTNTAKAKEAKCLSSLGEPSASLPNIDLFMQVCLWAGSSCNSVRAVNLSRHC